MLCSGSRQHNDSVIPHVIPTVAVQTPQIHACLSDWQTQSSNDIHANLRVGAPSPSSVSGFDCDCWKVSAGGH